MDDLNNLWYWRIQTTHFHNWAQKNDIENIEQYLNTIQTPCTSAHIIHGLTRKLKSEEENMKMEKNRNITNTHKERKSNIIYNIRKVWRNMEKMRNVTREWKDSCNRQRSVGEMIKGWNKHKMRDTMVVLLKQNATRYRIPFCAHAIKWVQ